MSNQNNECGLYCQVCASTEDTKSDFIKLYKTHTRYEIPETVAFGPGIATLENIVQGETEDEYIFTVNSYHTNIKSQFELSISDKGVQNIQDLFISAKLYLGGKLIDTVTSEFLNIYSLFSLKVVPCMNHNRLRLPFFCDRHDNTYLLHGKHRKCQMRVICKHTEKLDLTLHHQGGVIPINQLDYIDTHSVFFDQVVELTLKTESQKCMYFRPSNDDEWRITDMFLIVKGNINIPLIKKYMLYFDETTVQAGDNNFGVKFIVDDTTTIYHMRFSTELVFNKEYKLRPYTYLNGKHNAQLCIYLTDANPTLYSVRLLALTAASI